MLFPFVRTFYGASTSLFFSTSRLGVGSGDDSGVGVGDDDGRVGLGLDGYGHSLDRFGTMVDAAGGCEEVVVEIESSTGTRQGIRWVVCCLHKVISWPYVLLPQHFQIAHFHPSQMILI